MRWSTAVGCLIVLFGAVLASDVPQVIYRVQSYGAGYNAEPGITQAQADALIKALQAHTAALNRLTKTPVNGQQKDAPEGVPPPNKVGDENLEEQALLKGITFFKGRCAACHDKATSAKGGGFAITDGDNILLRSYKQLWNINVRTHFGEMPPQPKQPLTSEEFDVMMNALDILSRQPGFSKGE